MGDGDDGGFKLKRREDRWLMPDEAAALRAERDALRDRVAALEEAAALRAERDALRDRVAALEDAAGRAGMALWNWHAAGDDEAKLWAAIEERDYVLYTLYPRLGVERRRVFDEE